MYFAGVDGAVRARRVLPRFLPAVMESIMWSFFIGAFSLPKVFNTMAEGFMAATMCRVPSRDRVAR